MSDLLLNAWIENLINQEIQDMSEVYTQNKEALTQAGIQQLYFDCCRAVAYQAYRFGYERRNYHESKKGTEDIIDDMHPKDTGVL